MKILQVTYSLSSGGAERFLVDLSNQLIKRNEVSLTILSLVNDDDPKNRHYLNSLDSRINYVCLGAKKGLSFESFIKLYNYIKFHKPDIVHAHCQILLLYLPSIFLNKIKYFHTLHNMASFCLRFKILKYFNRYLYNNKVRPITISKICQQSFIELYKLSNSICIYNGRSPLILSEEKYKVENEVRSYKNSSSEKIFLHIARYAEQKNQKLLLETFSQMYKEGIPVRLLIIGSGFEKLDSDLHQFLTPNIHFLGEKVNIADYLINSDFFILSSLWEGLPISILEAMSLGLPSISTPVGGVPEVIIDGKTGFLSPSCELNDFYNTVRRALNEFNQIDPKYIKLQYESAYSMSICECKYYKTYII